MRIRRKIEPDPTRPSVIRTVRGGGYLFAPIDEKA
jgi:DNA-binding response OmpR family regulator